MRILIALAVILAGCGYQKVAVPVNETKTVEVEERKLTDEQKIALLRTEAHKRGLQWRVFCVYWASDDRFNAAAWHPGQDDTEHDRWIEEAPTQADAAYLLYKSIQQRPNHPGKPPERPDQTKEARELHKKMMCPPELRGD